MKRKEIDGPFSYHPPEEDDLVSVTSTGTYFLPRSEQPNRRRSTAKRVRVPKEPKTGGSLVKGSAAAKAHMARLRAMRGGGLKGKYDYNDTIANHRDELDFQRVQEYQNLVRDLKGKYRQRDELMDREYELKEKSNIDRLTPSPRSRHMLERLILRNPRVEQHAVEWLRLMVMLDRNNTEILQTQRRLTELARQPNGELDEHFLDSFPRWPGPEYYAPPSSTAPVLESKTKRAGQRALRAVAGQDVASLVSEYL